MTPLSSTATSSEKTGRGMGILGVVGDLEVVADRYRCFSLSERPRRPTDDGAGRHGQPQPQPAQAPRPRQRQAPESESESAKLAREVVERPQARSAAAPQGRCAEGACGDAGGLGRSADRTGFTILGKESGGQGSIWDE